MRLGKNQVNKERERGVFKEKTTFWGERKTMDSMGWFGDAVPRVAANEEPQEGSNTLI